MRLLLLLVFTLCLSACSEKSDSVTEGFTLFSSGEDVDVLSVENINQINKVYLSNSRLLNHLESLFVDLSGQFVIDRDGLESYIEVFSYSNSHSLSGSFVRLTSNVNDASTLDVEIFTGDNVAFDLCSVPFAISKNGEFNISIQFDNLISGGRITLWNKYDSPDRRINLSNNLFNINTASCTSQGRTSISYLGFGNRWGIVTNHLKVYEILRESPYDL